MQTWARLRGVCCVWWGNSRLSAALQPGDLRRPDHRRSLRLKVGPAVSISVLYKSI